MKRCFETCSNRGFHITFDNGITLSTQIGAGNYCDNYHSEFDFKNPRNSWKSDECEIAIMDKDGNFITKQLSNKDDVMGWVKFEKWLKVFDWCRNYKPEPHPKT